MKKYIAFLLLTLFAVTTSLAAERIESDPTTFLSNVVMRKGLNVGYIGNSLIVSNNATIESNLNIKRDATVKNLNVTNQLIVRHLATINTVYSTNTGNVLLFPNGTVDGKKIIVGDLTTTNLAVFRDFLVTHNLIASNSVFLLGQSLLNSLIVSNNALFSNGVTVRGLTTLNTLILTNDMTTSGEANFNGTQTRAKTLTVSNILTTTSNATLRGVTTLNKANATNLVTITGYDNTDVGDTIQQNGLFLDGAEDIDKQVVFSENGTNQWAIQAGWRNENGEYFYVFNPLSQINPLVISKSGRTGINKHGNIVYDYGIYRGNRSNDLQWSGTYTGYKDMFVRISVTNAGPPAKCKVDYSYDYVNWIRLVDGLQVSTSPQELDAIGVQVAWSSATGQDTNDVYYAGVYSQQPMGSLTVAPRGIKSFLTQTNTANENYVDATGELNITTPIGTTPILTLKKESALLIGLASTLSSLYFDMKTNATDAHIWLEYWNGSDWTRITSASHNLIDQTTNLLSSGEIFWDKSKITDWTTKTIAGRGPYYFLRLRSTNDQSTVPYVDSISPHGKTRFAVYKTYDDVNPAFRVEADGSMFINDYRMTESILKSFIYKFKAAFFNTQTQTLEANSDTIITFSNKVSDALNLYTTNSPWCWSPTNTGMHRIHLNLTFEDNLGNSDLIYVYLVENTTTSNLLEIINGADVADPPYNCNATYVFTPASITNTYQIKVLTEDDQTHRLIGEKNWWFGEKIN